MSALNLFIPISKVDVAKRLVYGIATAESEDRSGEVCDYATTKPYYEKWSGDIAKATGGKSLGNVRAMHGKVAAGKVTSISFDDDGKKIEVCAKVVDDAEWKKVEEGVYTGFSQGGAYVKRWTDGDGKQRYTAEPSEISLVDLPCLPEATFQVIKADGIAEDRAFKAPDPEKEPTNDEVAAKARDMAKAAGDETKWADHIVAARAELKKGGPTTPAAPAVPAAPVVEKTAAVDTPVSGEEWEQVWLCKRDGATFKTKAELRAHVAKLDADAAVANVAGAVLGKLDAIDEKLGIGKRAFTEEERATAAKSGAAMPDGSFPIHNREDVENAVKAYGRAKDKEAAKQHIMKRAEELGCNDCIPSDWKMAGKTAAAVASKEAARGELTKYMGEEVWDSSVAMSALQSLFSVLSSETYEGEENVDQTEALRDAIARVKDFIASEIQENNDMGDPALAMAAKAVLQKKGARNSKSDQTKIQDMHDAAVALGADCNARQAARRTDGADKAHEHADLAKAADDLAKVTAERDALQKALDEKIMPRLEEMAKRLDQIENTPLPLPISSASRSVTKAEDSARGADSSGDLEKILSTQEGRDSVAQLLIKAAQSNPRRMGG